MIKADVNHPSLASLWMVPGISIRAHGRYCFFVHNHQL